MQRLSHVLLLVIALVAGLTVGTMADRPAIPRTYSGLAVSPETGHAFYDALNLALDGGDTDALAALLSPSFVDHDAGSGVAQSSAEFLDRVSTLGQSSTVAPMIVEEIEVSGGNLIVHLGQTTELSLVGGVSIEQTWDQPAFEVLRVARGLVIDRWSTGINRLEATELEEIVLHAPGLTDLATTLVRIDIPAGMVHRLSSIGEGFLLIESGSARVHAVHSNGDEETVQLGRGSAISVNAGDHIELRSVDRERVTALVYTVKRRGATELIRVGSALPEQSEEVTHSLLWSGTLPQADGSTEHRLGRLVLPAGEEIRLTDIANATLLLAIDSGAIEIVAPESAISVLGEDFWPVEHANFASIDAQNAASLTGGSAITLRNVSEDPVTIVLVVIKAEAQSEPPNVSNPGPQGSA